MVKLCRLLTIAYESVRRHLILVLVLLGSLSAYAQTTRDTLHHESVETENFETRQRMLALRTNLVHDFLTLPEFGFVPTANLQAELFPRRGHLSVNIGFSMAHHLRDDIHHKFFEIRDLQLELRRYFRGHGIHRGPFIGIYAEGVMYDFGLSRSKGWQGEGGGGGLTFGHTMKLNRTGSIRLELTMSLGFLVTRQDRYVYGNPKTGVDDGLYYYDYDGEVSLFKRRNDKFTWFGPTNVGIQITYDVFYHKRRGGRR